MGSRKFLVEGFAFTNNLRLSSYDGSLIFKNLEEVKKVILAETGTGNRLCGSGKTKWVLIVSSRFMISHRELVTNLCESRIE